MTNEEFESGRATIPFGQKHKEQELSVTLFEDPQYVDWLANQDWVEEKYPEFNKQLQLFVNREDVQRRLESVFHD